MDKKILQLKSICTACMACYNVCPTHAISMKENDEGFMYPHIDFNKCNNCNLCVDRCPELNKNEINKHETLIQQAYYGWHTDDQIRKQSSSGGIFSALAEMIIEGGGIIYGAVYDSKEKNVLHKNSAVCEWTAMRKSKYVQSYIGHSYKDVKTQLDEGKIVLFVGTPCQVEGLKSFLNDHYDNLVTCDFICHGVPPMKLLNDHLNWIEKKFKSKVINIDFRPKTKGWTKPYMKVVMKNGRIYHVVAQFDPYFGSFLKGRIQREACFQCNYKMAQHSSDITLADFWGFRRYDTGILDERGLSLVMVNTNKGENALSALSKDRVKLISVEWEIAAYNFSKKACGDKGMRDIFYKDYREGGFEFVISKYKLTGSAKDKLYLNIFQFISKLQNKK